MRGCSRGIKKTSVNRLEVNWFCSLPWFQHILIFFLRNTYPVWPDIRINSLAYKLKSDSSKDTHPFVYLIKTSLPSCQAPKHPPKQFPFPARLSKYPPRGRSLSIKKIGSIKIWANRRQRHAAEFSRAAPFIRFSDGGSLKHTPIFIEIQIREKEKIGDENFAIFCFYDFQQRREQEAREEKKTQTTWGKTKWPDGNF